MTPDVMVVKDDDALDASGKSSTKKKKGKEAKEIIPTASCGELFRFATPVDAMLMVVGIIAAMGCGTAQPLFSVMFADLREQVGQAATGGALDWQTMLELSLYQVYIGIGC